MTKPIEVLGAGSDLCSIELGSVPFGASGIEALQINSGSARIGGFRLVPQLEGGDLVTPWVRVTNSIAPVELFDLRMDVDEPHAGSFGYVSVTFSRQVVLAGCHVVGPASFPAELTPGVLQTDFDGFPGLWAYKSAIWASDCTFEGNGTSNCYTGVIGAPPNAGAGAEILESDVVFSNTVLRGGQGSASESFCVPIAAAPGLHVKFASQVEIHTGPRSEIVGGFGVGDSAPGDGALVAGPTAFYYGTGELPIGGGSDSGGQGEAIGQASGSVTVLPTDGVRPTLRPDRYVLPIGSSVTLEHSGLPGALHWTFYSEGTASAGLAVPVVGKVFVQPSQASSFAPIVLDGAGVGSQVVQIPQEPSLIGFSGIFQIAQTGSGPLVLSTPIVLTIAP